MRYIAHVAPLVLSTIAQAKNVSTVIETVTVLRPWGPQPVDDGGCFCIVEGSEQGKGTRLYHNGDPRANKLETNSQF